MYFGQFSQIQKKKHLHEKKTEAWNRPWQTVDNSTLSSKLLLDQCHNLVIDTRCLLHFQLVFQVRSIETLHKPNNRAAVTGSASAALITSRHAVKQWKNTINQHNHKLSSTWALLDLRVGSSKSTWVFQVGSSQSVVASPSKFSGAVGLITSHFKSTWPIILHLVVLSYAAIGEFGRIGQFATSFSNCIYTCIPIRAYELSSFNALHSPNCWI